MRLTASRYVQCLGQTFALQQLTYTLLQLVKAMRSSAPESTNYHLSFATEAQPVGTGVPARWKTLQGKGKQERAFWSNNLTLYFKVSMLSITNEMDPTIEIGSFGRLLTLRTDVLRRAVFGYK